MGRYFGREPRYSQQEAEAQAKQAIDAAVNKGRPPAEEWKALASRMGDINRELAARPPVDVPPPPPPRRRQTDGADAAGGNRARSAREILRPAPPSAAPAKGVTPAAKAGRAPAKRAPAAPVPAAKKQIGRSARVTEPHPPAAAKRPASKKRPE